MMSIFRKKKPISKGIVESRLAGWEAQSDDSGPSLTAHATFSNPFGLGESDPSVSSAGGGGANVGAAEGGETGWQEGDRSGATGAIGGAENEIAAHTQARAAHGAEARDEPCLMGLSPGYRGP